MMNREELLDWMEENQVDVRWLPWDEVEVRSPNIILKDYPFPAIRNRSLSRALYELWQQWELNQIDD